MRCARLIALSRGTGAWPPPTTLSLYVTRAASVVSAPPAAVYRAASFPLNHQNSFEAVDSECAYSGFAGLFTVTCTVNLAGTRISGFFGDSEQAHPAKPFEDHRRLEHPRAVRSTLCQSLGRASNRSGTKCAKRCSRIGLSPMRFIAMVAGTLRDQCRSRGERGVAPSPRSGATTEVAVHAAAH